MPASLRPQQVAVTIGTRPEAIKLMPVLRALEARGAKPRVLLTGQHQELLDETLAELGIRPDVDLEVMTADQSLAELSARVLTRMQDLLRRLRPRVLVVQGDTTSVAMAALAAFYEGVPVAHVEAGLRTGSRRNPFPEEINRRLAGCLADVHFAPTPAAAEHLRREAVPESAIHMVGNTVVDALFLARDRLLPALGPPTALDPAWLEGRALVLLTTHRRESFGEDMRAVLRAVRRLAESLGDAAGVVFPVHLNPNVQAAVQETLADAPGVKRLPPLSYLRFVQLLLKSRLVITDSGGLQEEATALGIPTLVVRRTTERPEALEAGVAERVGPDEERLFATAWRLLTDAGAHAERARPSSVFGDGLAAERIVTLLAEAYGDA